MSDPSLPNSRDFLRKFRRSVSEFDEDNMAQVELKLMRDEAIWNKIKSASCPKQSPLNDLPPKCQSSQKAIEKTPMSAINPDWQTEKEQLMRRMLDYEKKLAEKEEHMKRMHEYEKQLAEKEKFEEKIALRISALETLLIENSMAALESVNSKIIKFDDLEKLTKPYVCFKLENGTIMYYDNVKPFSLFSMIESVSEFQTSMSYLRETRVDAESLKSLEGESDCSFKGVIGNAAYFSAVRGKKARFFKASTLNGQITFEEINALKTSDLIMFENEPMYYIEDCPEWSVYQYHEDYELNKGELFNISGIRSISKYERHYHRGVIYLFRESSKPKLEKRNKKFVIVEGPIFDGTLSFYTPQHSDCIYVANADQNALIVLDTTNLYVRQLIYEPPFDSTYHSIVGVHKGILIMAFEGKGVGRCLMTTRIS